MVCTYALAPLAPAPAAGTAVALGYFDGVHLGHRAVLRAAQTMAAREGLADAVFTFTLPLPTNAASGNAASTVNAAAADPAAARPAGKGRAILTQSEKQRRMAALGVQHYFCPPFDSFCALTPEQFVDEVLVRCLGARHVFCGDNFSFGAHKSGNVNTLRALCGARGIGVHVVPMARYAGETVSSSRVRAQLSVGDMAAVNAMLGEAYRIDLPVRHGRGFGRTMGFPTINQMYPPELLRPADGVYITSVRVRDAWLPGATGLGARPTVGGHSVTCETFIADYDGDLYGETMDVRFHAFLKPTVKFDAPDALKAYIDDAARSALAYFAAQPDALRA